MSTPTARRSLLPLLTAAAHVTNRSAQTCEYRCGNQCAQPVPNTSDNTYFGDIATSVLSRRRVLQAGAAGTFAAVAVAYADATPAAADTRGLDEFGMIPATPADVDDVIVPDGYDWAPIISWGDPLWSDTAEFDFDAQTPEKQRRQAGYNCDYLHLTRGNGRNTSTSYGLLVFNNEYTNDNLMFRDYTSAGDLTVEQLEIIMAAHGMTIVEVERRGPKTPYSYLKDGARNRRIHTHTPFTVDGPAAGSPMLRTAADPAGRTVLGTLNNCAGGDTPWGTILSGEENFNQYFNATGADDSDGALARYGITSGGRGWERADERFLVADHPNEVNRFGWIVEVDPDDPDSTPVKHTALGRFKHEGATIRLAEDGRAVAYMGDDERFDYMYKFVSKDRYSRRDKAHNMRLLSEGDLYVAKFVGDGLGDDEYDGTGAWLPLVVEGASQVPGMSVEEVLVHTRLAADLVGPTKMDRPEDVEPNPVTGKVYAALTNNTRRAPTQIDEANPRANDKFGHIIELTEAGDDAAALTFTWKIVLVAGTPDDPSTYFYGFDTSLVSPISCPDNVTFDSAGNLWISTDGQPGTIAACDGLFLMPLEGEQRGRVRQFLSVPVGAETCGPVVHWDERSVLVCVQHPGEVDGASPTNVVSQFPYLGDGQPRPGVIQAYLTDPGAAKRGRRRDGA